MNKAFIKPAKKEVIVPNPDNGNKPLSENGEAVQLSRYWSRRLKDGDVIGVKPEKKTKK